MLTKNELKSYAQAGSIAEQAISSIRTVFAFNGVQKEHARYVENLEKARQSGIKKAMFTGIMLGVLWMVIQCSYAVRFFNLQLLFKEGLNKFFLKLSYYFKDRILVRLGVN
jgi:thiamine transporter ThiT